MLKGMNIMRRSDREIKEFDEIIKVMEKCDVCRLALFDQEYPYILPLNFGMQVQGGQIVLYFHGALEGKKYELIEKNNKAGFEMDCTYRLIVDEESQNCTMEYESVIGNGIVEFVDEDEKLEALDLLMRHYRQEDFPINIKVLPHTKVFKLTVNSLTGKARMVKN
jgi:nitroimidazol reductase NimA-like FMN-containing flavoprotein (pyridoxamine 5'-phosphate oxidase superfamily)